MQSTYARNDNEFFFLESGGGSSSILLLHGLNESSEGYRSVIGRLGENLHIYSLDFRGHGLSPWSEPYRVMDYASDVIKFIQTKAGEPLYLAGHSLGGLVATYVASHQVELVRGLILEDPPFYTAQMPIIKETPFYPMFRGARKLLQEHQDAEGTAQQMVNIVGQWQIGGESSATFEAAFGKEFVVRLALELHRSDPRVLDPVLDGTLFEGFDPDVDLPRVTCPTYLIAGSFEHGGSMRPQDIEKTTALIPNCVHVVWDDVGHDIHTIKPDKYAKQVFAFINGIDQNA